MSLKSQFATDRDKEVEGVAVEYAPNDDGTVPTFYITRMGRTNRAYTKALETASRPYRRQLEMGLMKNEQAERLSLEVFCGTVLRRWENVQEDDGTPIAFNRANAIQLFTDLPDLYDDLQQKAQAAATFKSEQQEQEAKN